MARDEQEGQGYRYRIYNVKLTLKVAHLTIPASTCFISSLWSVRISFSRCRSVLARNTSISARGYPSESVSGVSTPMGSPPSAAGVISSSTIAAASDSSAFRLISSFLRDSLAAFSWSFDALLDIVWRSIYLRISHQPSFISLLDWCNTAFLIESSGAFSHVASQFEACQSPGPA